VEPMREAPRTMTCVCRLRVTTHPDAVFRNLGHDSCMCTTNIDQPVCVYCEAAGHHQQDNFDPIIKEVDRART